MASPTTPAATGRPRGLKQGHFNGSQYYGEALFDYLHLAHTVALPSEEPSLVLPPPGEAIVPPPTPLSATGRRMKVKTQDSMLRLRSAPEISSPATANVIAHMPDGHPVRAVGGKAINGFLEIETSLQGALLRGYASAKLLVPDPSAEPDSLEPLVPAPALPTEGIVAAYMPRKAGRITRRSDSGRAPFTQ